MDLVNNMTVENLIELLNNSEEPITCVTVGYLYKLLKIHKEPIIIYYPDISDSNNDSDNNSNNNSNKKPKIEAKMWFDLEGKLHRDDEPALIKFDRHGKITEELWYQHGILSSTVRPSHIICRPDRIEKWYLNGKIHRDNGPAVIIGNGDFIKKLWYTNGINYRKDGPSLTEHKNDNIVTERYHDENGKLHNHEDGPAELSYNSDGTISCELYNIHGKYVQTDDKPNLIRRNQNGLKYADLWLIDNGISHRENGPARIKYNPLTGEIEKEEWYINGKRIKTVFYS